MGEPRINVARLPIYHKNFKNLFQKFHLKFFFLKSVKISRELAKSGNEIPGFPIFSGPAGENLEVFAFLRWTPTQELSIAHQF